MYPCKLLDFVPIKWISTFSIHLLTHKALSYLFLSAIHVLMYSRRSQASSLFIGKYFLIPSYAFPSVVCSSRSLSLPRRKSLQLLRDTLSLCWMLPDPRRRRAASYINTRPWLWWNLDWSQARSYLCALLVCCRVRKNNCVTPCNSSLQLIAAVVTTHSCCSSKIFLFVIASGVNTKWRQCQHCDNLLQPGIFPSVFRLYPASI